MPEDIQETIKRRFASRPPNSDQAKRMAVIRNRCQELSNELLKLCPESRELSRALTAVDDVAAFGQQAITRNEERGKVDDSSCCTCGRSLEKAPAKP